jgi:hypothetical protein
MLPILRIQRYTKCLLSIGYLEVAAPEGFQAFVQRRGSSWLYGLSYQGLFVRAELLLIVGRLGLAPNGSID